MRAAVLAGLLVAGLLLAGCAQMQPPAPAQPSGAPPSLGSGDTASYSGPPPRSGTGQQQPPPSGGSGGSGGPGAPPSGGSGGSGGGGGAGGSGGTTSSQSTGVGWDVSADLHKATWLCQDSPITVNDLSPSGTDGQQCKVALTFSSTTVTVASTGIPNYDFESGSGCCAKTQTLSNTFPLHPTLATAVTYPSNRGSIATAVNGVAIFGPEDSQGSDVVIATYSDPSTQPRLALCDAHSEPMSGTYHYHADGNCIHWHPSSGQSMKDYDFSKVDSSTHSRIIGFAPDGFPIYGSYGYAADNVTIKEITSSYRLKDGKTGSGGSADQEYVAGLGDLDECNGKVGPTPEFPAGIYHYYSTKHNGAGSWGFPYFPLCYKGVVTSSGMRGGGGSGSGSSGSMSSSGSMTGPPPSGGGGGSGTGMPPPPPPGGGGGPPPPP